MNMNAQARSGFTLIEILIAVAIVGIMAAVVGPKMLDYLKTNKVKAAKQSLRSLNAAVESFYGDIAEFPDTLEDLIKKPSNEELAKEWVAPYIKGKSVPKDPWNHAYQYNKTSGAEHPYELYSYGAKGRTAPQAEWISAWDL